MKQDHTSTPSCNSSTFIVVVVVVVGGYGGDGIGGGFTVVLLGLAYYYCYCQHFCVFVSTFCPNGNCITDLEGKKV